MKQKLALTFLLVALVLFGLAVAVGVIVGKNGKDYSQIVLAHQTLSLIHI